MLCILQLSLLASQIVLAFLANQVAGAATIGRGGGRVPLGPSAGDLVRAGLILRDLRARGLQGTTVFDPITGNLVVGTADQPLPQLAAEAAERQLSQEAIAEILREDPLFFIRLLPPGDPRRIAVGLNGSSPTTSPAQRRGVAIVPGAPPLQPRRRPGLFQRTLSAGRVAVR